MTTMQRVAFFKLVGKAHSKSGIGDREVWRKAEMDQAIPGCHSVSQVLTAADYDSMMLHFAKLAEDFGAVAHYAAAAEKRMRHVLGAVAADLEHLRGVGIPDAYMEAIYRQAGGASYATLDDIPAEHLRLLVQIADSHVRRLRKAARLRPSDLPSAGYPWRIRGHRAAIEADAIHRRKIA
jgi:hypothetical protein